MCVAVAQWRSEQSALLLPTVWQCAVSRHWAPPCNSPYLWSDNTGTPGNSAHRLRHLCIASGEGHRT